MIATRTDDTTDDDIGTGPADPIEPAAPAPLSTTALITLFGTLTWLGAMWAVVAVGYAIAVAAVARWGSLDVSLWAQAAAGWQRWPIFGAGVTMMTVFGPMFITNGVLRARLARSSIITMVAVAVLGALYVIAGFAIESVIFDANDWTHRVNDMRFFDDLGAGHVTVAFVVVFAAYFLAGWIVGLSFQRFGWVGVAVAPLAAVPVVVSEACVMLDVGTQFDFLDRTAPLSLWLGAGISTAVVAIWVAGAARLTREMRVG